MRLSDKPMSKCRIKMHNCRHELLRQGHYSHHGRRATSRGTKGVSKLEKGSLWPGGDGRQGEIELTDAGAVASTTQGPSGAALLAGRAPKTPVRPDRSPPDGHRHSQQSEHPPPPTALTNERGGPRRSRRDRGACRPPPPSTRIPAC